MYIIELLVHREQRTQHHPDRLPGAVALIDHFIGEGVGFQPLGNPGEGCVGNVRCGAADAPSSVAPESPKDSAGLRTGRMLLLRRTAKRVEVLLADFWITAPEGRSKP